MQSADFADIRRTTSCLLAVFANGHSRATEHWIGSHFEYWKERTTIMVMKRLIGVVFAGALAFSAMAGEVVVKLAPPKIVIEKRGTPPSPRHVWISGYHNWDGQKYVWTAGRWEVPPQGHSKWVAHRWVHRNGGYVLVEGHWQ